MDEERLISAVQKRSLLYNKADPKYTNRVHTRKAWEDVGDEINCHPDAAKKKWVGLRDYFQRQNRYYKEMQPGDGAIKRKKWPLYEKLTFLIPYLSPRETSGNLDNISDIDTTEQLSLSCDEEINAPYSVETNEPSTSSLSIRPAKRAKISSPNFDLEILKALKETDTDEDLCFFRSLLPTMKTLLPMDKLEFRHEVHGLLLKYARRSEMNGSQYVESTYSFADPVDSKEDIIFDKNQSSQQETTKLLKTLVSELKNKIDNSSFD